LDRIEAVTADTSARTERIEAPVEQLLAILAALPQLDTTDI
jgi:hypothetical protein